MSATSALCAHPHARITGHPCTSPPKAQLNSSWRFLFHRELGMNRCCVFPVAPCKKFVLFSSISCNLPQISSPSSAFDAPKCPLQAHPKSSWSFLFHRELGMQRCCVFPVAPCKKFVRFPSISCNLPQISSPSSAFDAPKCPLQAHPKSSWSFLFHRELGMQRCCVFPF